MPETVRATVCLELEIRTGQIKIAVKLHNFLNLVLRMQFVNVTFFATTRIYC